MLFVYARTLFSDFSAVFAETPQRPAYYGLPQIQHPPWLHPHQTQNPQKSGNGFKVSQPKESPQKAWTRDLVLDSCFDKPLNQGQSSHYLESQNQRLSFGSAPLGSLCALSFTVVLRELTIWGATWTTAGQLGPTDSMEDPCTSCEFSEEWFKGQPLKLCSSNHVWTWCCTMQPLNLFTPTLHTYGSQCNISIIRAASCPHHLTRLICKCEVMGGAGWQVSRSMCTHIIFLQDTFFLAHDLKRPRDTRE